MSGKLFGQIVGLIIILAIVTSAAKCLHKVACPKCQSRIQQCLAAKGK